MRNIVGLLLLATLSMTGGSLQAACQAGIPLSTPDSDLIPNNDGTVTHSKTGLMWKVCSEGQAWQPGNCTGTAGAYTWQAALQIPESLNAGGGFAGFTDWRLPNIKELASIVELGCYSPAINSKVFPATSSNVCWSDSPLADLSGRAWGVNFNYGYDYYDSRNSTHRVRLVRGGQ